MPIDTAPLELIPGHKAGEVIYETLGSLSIEQESGSAVVAVDLGGRAAVMTLGLGDDLGFELVVVSDCTPDRTGRAEALLTHLIANPPEGMRIAPRYTFDGETYRARAVLVAPEEPTDSVLGCIASGFDRTVVAFLEYVPEREPGLEAHGAVRALPLQSAMDLSVVVQGMEQALAPLLQAMEDAEDDQTEDDHAFEPVNLETIGVPPSVLDFEIEGFGATCVALVMRDESDISDPSGSTGSMRLSIRLAEGAVVAQLATDVFAPDLEDLPYWASERGAWRDWMSTFLTSSERFTARAQRAWRTAEEGSERGDDARVFGRITGVWMAPIFESRDLLGHLVRVLHHCLEGCFDRPACLTLEPASLDDQFRPTVPSDQALERTLAHCDALRWPRGASIDHAWGSGEPQALCGNHPGVFLVPRTGAAETGSSG